MARVNRSVFAARKGATLMCGAGHPIEKGETYVWTKPRFGGKRVRCLKHPFKQSELVTSKLSGAYAAQEEAEAALDALAGPEDDASSIRDILETAATDIEAVADEYREAAEASPTGLIFGEDYNERADIVADAANTLTDLDIENEPDFDNCDNEAHEDDPAAIEALQKHGIEVVERGNTTDCASCEAIKQEWWDEQVDKAKTAIGDLSYD